MKAAKVFGMTVPAMLVGLADVVTGTPACAITGLVEGSRGACTQAFSSFPDINSFCFAADNPEPLADGRQTRGPRRDQIRT